MANVRPQPSHFAATTFANNFITTGYHPGSPPLPDNPEEAWARIYSKVEDFLSEEERNAGEFKQPMSQNKINVVGLFYETVADYLPGLGSTTYNVFGYSKLHELDHISLLGLYRGLTIALECGIDDFLAAYEDGRLFSFIQEQFSRIPAGNRGGYYKWFLGQEELFNSLKPPAAQELREGNVAQNLSARCHVCEKKTSSRCGRCKKVSYCSKEHQKADWHQHKKVCGKD